MRREDWMVVSDGDGLYRRGRRGQGLSQQSGARGSRTVGLRVTSEPDRGRRHWKKHPEARDPVYRNRRRIGLSEANGCFANESNDWAMTVCASSKPAGCGASIPRSRPSSSACCYARVESRHADADAVWRRHAPEPKGCATMLLDTFGPSFGSRVLWPHRDPLSTFDVSRPPTGDRDDRRLHVLPTVFTTGC